MIADCKDITIQHRGSAYIRLLDKTVVTFQHQGKQVRLATRTLRDFSQQLRQCYSSGALSPRRRPTADPSPAVPPEHKYNGLPCAGPVTCGHRAA